MTPQRSHSLVPVIVDEVHNALNPTHRQTPSFDTTSVPLAAATMPVDIPLELVEHILSQLRGDVPALTKCSLVGREWLTICRRWLFQTVDVSTAGYLYRMGGRYNRFRGFMNLIDMPGQTATFTQYVKHLELDSSFTPYLVGHLSEASLPNLHSIRLKGGSTNLPPYLLSALSTTFSDRIDQLDVTGLVFPSASSLVAFLCGFPRLKQLALGDNGFQGHLAESKPLDSDNLVLPASLATLQISQSLGHMLPEVIQWLLGQLRKESISLRKLEYKADAWSTFTPELLATVADTLEELDVCLNSTDAETISLLGSPKLEFPSLQTLHFTFRIPLITGKQSTREFMIFMDRDRSGVRTFLSMFRDMDIALGHLITSLQAAQLTGICVTFLPRTFDMHIEGLHKFHTMFVPRFVEFGNFDKALAERGSKCLPMLRDVEFLSGQCVEGVVRVISLR